MAPRFSTTVCIQSCVVQVTIGGLDETDCSSIHPLPSRSQLKYFNGNIRGGNLRQSFGLAAPFSRVTCLGSGHSVQL